MLSQTVEYALRAMVVLADRAPAPQTNEQIAQTTRVPSAYLSKVLQSLGRAGILRAQRGLHGGFSLTRPAEEITLLEVVNSVAPIQRIHECPLGLPTHGAMLCPLHYRLDKALALVEEAFGDTTLAEILSEPGRSHPLCEVPPPTDEK